MSKHIKKNLTSSSLDGAFVGGVVIAAIALAALISGFIGGTII